MVIWKYALLSPAWQGYLSMPKGAHFRHFDFQHNNPTLWFEVDPDAPLEHRQFEVVGTGFEIPYDGRYLSSVQVREDGGPYWVWHAYETTRKEGD